MGVWLVGVDTGGTFTDLIAVEQTTGELRRAKVPSVSGDPSAAVLDAMDKLFADGIDPGDISLFVHGTTVATNALLEGKGVRTGLLITRGFRAVYEARGWSQPRGSDLLDTFYQKPPLLAPQFQPWPNAASNTSSSSATSNWRTKELLIGLLDLAPR